MKARDYILTKMRNLVDKFPQIRARYEFNALTGAHFVEVVPSIVFRSDDDYIAWEDETTSEFIQLFPSEGIGFISDDSSISIENAECVFEGKAFISALTLSPTIIVEPISVMMGQLHTSTTRAVDYIEQSNQNGHIGYAGTSSLTYRLAA